MKFSQFSPRTTVLQATAVAVLALSASTVFAQGMMGPGDKAGHHGMHAGKDHADFAKRRVEHMSKIVGATDEQKAKLLTIAEGSAKNMQALHEKQRDLHKREMDLMTAATIDRNAINRLNAEQAANHDALRQIRDKAQLDSAEVLTAEQRTKLASNMKNRMEQHKGHMGPGHGKANGPKSMDYAAPAPRNEESRN